MKSILNALFLVAVASSLFLSGCSGGKPVKPAKGKVIAEGKPVTYGSVTFTPVATATELEAGKPASGAVGSDGTFVLSTFDRFDGAVVGKHSVRFNNPEDEEAEEEGATVDEAGPQEAKQATQPKRQYVQKEEIIVEVTPSGPNDFTIELQPRK